MGIYELVPYWEPQYLKCQEETIQQPQLQENAMLQSSSALYDNAFQSMELLKSIFSVQACIPYISIVLIMLMLGIYIVVIKRNPVKSALNIWAGEVSKMIKSVQIFLFFLVGI
jgi:hypothetical protein